MLKYLKTNLSKAYWCTFSDRKQSQFESARETVASKIDYNKFFELKEDGKIDLSRLDVSWFDSLFEGGGMKIPEKGGQPLTMLISGPPGSGKTTLALELCLRIAITHGLLSLYISTESETDLLTDKLNSFKIKNSENRILAFQKRTKKLFKSKYKDDKGVLMVYGKENVTKWNTFSEIVEAALDDALKLMPWMGSQLQKKIFKSLNRSGIPRFSPDILVFDSLNMAESNARSNLFEKIVRKVKDETKLIIVILDSTKKNGEHNNWEFACDNIIRLDYGLIKLDSTTMRDYYVRSIEIVKARYQGHVWGKQQMKIYPSFSGKRTRSVMRRAHPYREEGGIFIYPSIHYFLSRYKRAGANTNVKPIKTPCDGLNKVIKGFPQGRCTALMGIRGGHKSHLGYLHILQEVVDGYHNGEDKAGLIISLRDDEQMTRQHLIRILTENMIIKHREEKGSTAKINKGDLKKKATKLLKALEEKDLLEILYFPPGYITPDEFFHRMFMSIYRFKYGNKDGTEEPVKSKKITLLFNSLDQLAARFPLLAHQPIFVPALIQSLSGEEVTSIFIAVDEAGQPPTQYGLLPMADLILAFGRYRVKNEDYHAQHGVKRALYREKQSEDNSKRNPSSETNLYREVVMLEVKRFAGGEQAGNRGILELIYSDSKIVDRLIGPRDPGLHFFPWDHNYYEIESQLKGTL